MATALGKEYADEPTPEDERKARLLLDLAIRLRDQEGFSSGVFIIAQGLAKARREGREEGMTDEQKAAFLFTKALERLDDNPNADVSDIRSLVPGTEREGFDLALRGRTFAEQYLKQKGVI